MTEIPPPTSRAVPTEEDLKRDRLFLRDFKNGFMSRGVTNNQLELVRRKRQALVLNIHKVLLKFVSDMIQEKLFQIRQFQKQKIQQQQKQQQQSSSSSVVPPLSAASLAAAGFHPIFSHPDFLEDTSCCSWADVRSYGSVAIDADLVDSDIDLVCIVPDFIFFFICYYF